MENRRLRSMASKPEGILLPQISFFPFLSPCVPVWKG
jgi:hypothetical protein